MTSASMNIKIDPALKRESQTLFESLGLSLSAAINIFLRQAVREQAIPFRVGMPASPDSYQQKLERGLEQVRTGNGVTKSLKELERMAEDEG